MYSDLTVVAEGKQIQAHRLVLQSRGKWLPSGDLDDIDDPDGYLTIENLKYDTA